MYVIVIAIGHRLVPHSVGPAHPRVGEHPRRPTRSGQRAAGCVSRNVVFGGFVPGWPVRRSRSLDRPVPEERLIRAGVHRAGGPDLRADGAREVRSCSAVLSVSRARCRTCCRPSKTPVQIPSYFLAMTPYLATITRWPGWWAGSGRRPRTASPTSRGEPCHERSTRNSWYDGRLASVARGGGRGDEPGLRAVLQLSGGGAGLVDDGRVVSGCNVENASYGLTLCAECGLVSELVRSGGGRLVAVCCVMGRASRSRRAAVPPAVVRARWPNCQVELADRVWSWASCFPTRSARTI